MKYLGSKTIETERLILKAQTMKEQKTLWQILMLPKVNRYYLTIPKKYAANLYDWDKQQVFYEQDMKHANDLTTFKWSVFIKDTNECIGRVSCHEAHTEDEKIIDPNIRGVGWFINPKYQGCGYGREAANAMMKYMFEDYEIAGIKTGAAVNNQASWSIMEKFGFIREKEIKMIDYTFVAEPVCGYQYYLTRDMYLENNNNKRLSK